MKPRRQRRCKVCLEKYTPTNPLQTVCLRFECAIQYGKRLKQKQAQKERREGLVNLRTRSDWMKLAQVGFNRYIRGRDALLPCISCGRHNDVKYNAGHYRSVGACPELRFDERNVHKQCEHCNSYKSGNAIEYRLRLIQRVGQAVVDELEGPHEPKKYTVEDLKQIIATYREKLRELRKSERRAA